MATALKREAGIGEAERAARQELAACFRVFDFLGWTESIYNHITVAVPGEEGAFLINPFGLMYREVTASSLIKIDIEGNQLSPSEWPVNKAGFVQHSTFHRALSDVRCVMHTHTTAGMAVACAASGLTPTSFYAAQLTGRVAYHDFEGVTVREEEGERLLRNLGDRRHLILRSHGPVTMGSTIPEAFLRMFLLQRACELQLATSTLGPLVPIPQDIIDVHQRDAVHIQDPATYGQADFAAYVRAVDRVDPSWRD